MDESTSPMSSAAVSPFEAVDGETARTAGAAIDTHLRHMTVVPSPFVTRKFHIPAGDSLVTPKRAVSCAAELTVTKYATIGGCFARSSRTVGADVNAAPATVSVTGRIRH